MCKVDGIDQIGVGLILFKGVGSFIANGRKLVYLLIGKCRKVIGVFKNAGKAEVDKSLVHIQKGWCEIVSVANIRRHGVPVTRSTTPETLITAPIMLRAGIG